MKNKILLLSPKNSEKNPPTKKLDKNLNKLKSYTSGKLFHFKTLKYLDFHKALKKIFTYDDCFLVLGELNEYGEVLEEEGRIGTRRKKKSPNDDLYPTIQDREGNQMVLDMDDIILKGFEANDPEPAIKKWLIKKKIDCDVTYQITSSQKLKTNLARIRLYFVLCQNYPLIERKAFAQNPIIGCDGSVFTCMQPIYTAPPIIDGKDPILKRSGFIKGKRRKYLLPKLKAAEIQKYSDTFSAYDFDFEGDLPEEVLNGTIYRRYFMPLAFHYMNKLNGDSDAVFHIIAGKAQKVKNRVFDPENVKQYLETAKERISSENEESVDLEEFEQNEEKAELEEKLKKIGEKGKIPVFPKNPVKNWPKPWPYLWDNWIKIPRELSPELLFPTFLSAHAFFLDRGFTSQHGRDLNFFFLCLSPSTGGKDTNSRDVLSELKNLYRKEFSKFKSNGLNINVFNDCLGYADNVTSETAVYNNIDEKGRCFFITTEGTPLIKKISSPNAGAEITGIEQMICKITDGRGLPAKKFAGKQRQDEGLGHEHVNMQTIIYAQPKTVTEHVKPSMVESGFLGRSAIIFSEEKPLVKEDFKMFEVVNDKRAIDKKVDEDFLGFYGAKYWNHYDAESSGEGERIIFTEKQAGFLNDFFNENHFITMTDNIMNETLIKRIGILVEYLYATAFGVSKTWAKYKGEKFLLKPFEKAEFLKELMDYFVATKDYSVRHLIKEQSDPTHTAVLETFAALKSGIRMVGSGKKEFIEEGWYPKGKFCDIARGIKGYKKACENIGIRGSRLETIKREVNAMIETGAIVMREYETIRTRVTYIKLINIEIEED